MRSIDEIFARINELLTKNPNKNDKEHFNLIREKLEKGEYAAINGLIEQKKPTLSISTPLNFFTKPTPYFQLLSELKEHVKIKPEQEKNEHLIQLVRAISRGDLPLFQKMLAQGDITLANAKYTGAASPFLKAGENLFQKSIEKAINIKDIYFLIELLEKGGSLIGKQLLDYLNNPVNKNNVGLLMNLFTEAIKTNPNARNYKLTDDGYSLLHYAAKEKYSDLVSTFIDKKFELAYSFVSGAEIDSIPLRDALCHHAMQKAIKDNDINLLIMLLEKENPFIGEQLLKEFAKAGEEELHSVAKLLAEYFTKNPMQARNYLLNSEDYTLLHFATKEDLIDLVRVIAATKVGINVQTLKGMTALMIACSRDEESIVRELLLAGADPNTVMRGEENESYSPLRIAVEQGNPDFVRLLLASGAKIDPVSYGIAKENAQESTGNSSPEKIIATMLREPFRQKKHSVLDIPQEREKYDPQDLPPVIKIIADHIYFENPQKRFDFLNQLKLVYEENEFLRPSLHIVALSMLKIRNPEIRTQEKEFKGIFIEDKNIESVVAGGEKAIGVYTDKNTVFMTTHANVHSPKYLVAMFLHETNHFSDYETHGDTLLSDNNPSTKKSFFSAKAQVAELVKHANIKNPAERLLVSSFKSVFDHYPQRLHETELLARIPEVFGTLGYEEGKQWLETNTPLLLKFYQDHFMCVCEEYLERQNATDILEIKNSSFSPV